MNCYKVSLLRIGHVMVRAESKEDAAKKAGKLPEENIHWMNELDELQAPYLVTVIELVDGDED